MADKKLEDMKKELLMQPKNGWDGLKPAEIEKIMSFSEGYKTFLDSSTTEREACARALELAEKNGFKQYSRGMTLKPGDRIYAINRARALVFAVIGKKDMEAGVNIIASHIDAPRLDLKPRPLYEEDELAFFKTHYYGGIKKYQWTALPLMLKGVAALRNGGQVTISIGDEKGDPVLTITDLLPHLAKDQYAKKLGDAIPAETLNVLIGSIPVTGEGSDRVKLAVMQLFNQKYGLIERDLVSAELVIVPALPTRDVGLDRSMVGGYGQDDRVCAFTSLEAIFGLKNPAKTAVCFLADKEEIGSEGVSGMQSHFFDTFITDLCETSGARIDICFEGSACISADVVNGHDPNYADVSDRRNNARMNYGLAIMKYSGSRGKSGTSDASAEFMEQICSMLDHAGIAWQTATLGKADQGGGGTVAVYMARRNIGTIDAGVPVLSMHSPFEITSKLDIYRAFEGFSAFYRAE